MSTPACTPQPPIILDQNEPIAKLANSLSRNLADYEIVTSEPGKIMLQARETHSERLLKAKEKLEDAEKDQMALKRAHIYSLLCYDLHLMWWHNIPDNVQFVLNQYDYRNLPKAFAHWWLEWNEIDPIRFPIPPSMNQFGTPRLKHLSRLMLDNNGQESQLSKAIGIAFDMIPATGRHLMLFSWTGLESIRAFRNQVAHPDMNRSTAREILRQDFGSSLEELRLVANMYTDSQFSD